MPSGILYRLSGIALLLGTLLIVLFSGIGFELFGTNQLSYLLTTNGLIMLSQRQMEIVTGPLWLPVNLGILAGWMLLVAGLSGLYAYLARWLGWLGLLGFVLTMASLLLLGVINLALYAFILPIIAPHIPHLLSTGQPVPGLEGFYVMASLLFSLGAFLFGFGILHARVVSHPTKITGVALIVAAVCKIVRIVPLPDSVGQLMTIGSHIGALSFLFGLAVFGSFLVSQPRAETTQPPLIPNRESTTMSPAMLYRFSGLALLVGPLFAIPAGILRLADIEFVTVISLQANPLFVPGYLAGLVAALLILLGLPGMFVYLASPVRWLGLIGFVLIFFSTLLLGVIDMGLYSLGIPLLATLAPQILNVPQEFYWLPPAPPAFYLVSHLAFCIGVMLFGRAVIRAAVLPHEFDVCGWLLILVIGPLDAVAIVIGVSGSHELYSLFVFGLFFSYFLFFLMLAVWGGAILVRSTEAGPIIGRPLVYGTLTAIVITGYVLVVGSIGVLVLQTRITLMLTLVLIGLIAFLIQPLRERLQRAVNRLMYGERDNPYAVLSQLGKHIEATLAPESVLPTIVETIARSLKLPYTAIALKREDELTVAAAYGSPLEEQQQLFSLVYQGEQLGELIFSPRSPGETLTPADQRLLHVLAPQISVALNAVRLTVDLQRSRERLVTAREEERRRLRRDLHDGLGPQLATLTLKLETARNRLANDSLSDDELADLTTRTQAAVADIRRLVYALRPPTLDELGLLNALREQAMQYGDQIDIQLILLERLPPLSAAVEVALYRITQEALTNVVRHAHASHCSVHLRLDEQASLLLLDIQDDGCGLPAERRVGVGLVSMRERAEELGGTFLIEPVYSGGTHVLIQLPSRVPETTDVIPTEIPILQEEE